MKRFVIILVTLVFLISACASSQESKVKELPLPKLFLAMNPDATYSESVTSGKDAVLAELAKSECPSAGDAFLRANLESPVSQLVIYTNEDVSSVQCSILKPKKEPKIDLKPSSEAPSPDVAVVVNGAEITMAALQNLVAQLPESSRNVDGLNDVVNRLINDELLRQASKDISVTPEQIKAQEELILTNANLTKDSLKTLLAEQNITQEQWEENVVQQARVQELLQDRLLLDTLSVTEEDAKEFYLNNPNAFLQSEQAVARFLIIGSKGRSLEQGRARAQEVVDKISTTDYCALVREYSDDGEQAKEQCGIYTISRGVLAPNLESAAFGTPENQTAMVTTDDGIFLVQTLRVTPTQVVPYNDVAPLVASSLKNALFTQRLNLYIAQLRSEATITSYLG